MPVCDHHAGTPHGRALRESDPQFSLNPTRLNIFHLQFSRSHLRRSAVQKLKANEQPTLPKQPILVSVGILVCPLPDSLSAVLCRPANPLLVLEHLLSRRFFPIKIISLSPCIYYK